MSDDVWQGKAPIAISILCVPLSLLQPHKLKLLQGKALRLPAISIADRLPTTSVCVSKMGLFWLYLVFICEEIYWSYENPTTFPTTTVFDSKMVYSGCISTSFMKKLIIRKSYGTRLFCFPVMVTSYLILKIVQNVDKCRKVSWYDTMMSLGITEESIYQCLLFPSLR
jgi:hypothetical protein